MSVKNLSIVNDNRDYDRNTLVIRISLVSSEKSDFEIEMLEKLSDLRAHGISSNNFVCIVCDCSPSSSSPWWGHAQSGQWNRFLYLHSTLRLVLFFILSSCHFRHTNIHETCVRFLCLKSFLQSPQHSECSATAKRNAAFEKYLFDWQIEMTQNEIN